MKKLYFVLIVLLAISPVVISTFLAGTQTKKITSEGYDEKIYVALEAIGKVGVIDTKTRKVIRTIDLSEKINGVMVDYMAHNVQVSPDGRNVIVTANVNRNKTDNMSGSKMAEATYGLFDKIIIIDPLTDTVVDHISIAIDAHLAHVVINKQGDTAYISSQEKGKVFAYDIEKNRINEIFDFGQNSGPHGLRMLRDNSKIFVALMGKKAMASIDRKSGKIQYFPLSGSAVQTAVTPDGQYVFATIYESKKVAWVKVQTNEQGYIDLPSDAKGPIQIYSTPDSKYLYVADQGYYFGQPTGDKVYRINISEKNVDQTIKAGKAPHGVVVDKAGDFVYITNLVSNSVSVIDTRSNKEIDQIPVGEMPNGISIWNKKLGGTE